jgi:hypothetical protein
MQPVKVFLTWDCEVWPFDARFPYQRLPESKSYETEFLAYAGRGYSEGHSAPHFNHFQWQLDKLTQYGLKGIFFLETMHADAIGGQFLELITKQVRQAGQEIGLHLHPEWSNHLDKSYLPETKRDPNPAFNEEDYEHFSLMVKRGVAALEAYVGSKPKGYRAGSFLMRPEFSKALFDAGIRYDFSHNPAIPGSTALRQKYLRSLATSGQVNKSLLAEIPVTTFISKVSGLRHLQLNGCSHEITKSALEAAYRDQISFCVIVLHPFDFIRIEKARRLQGVKRIRQVETRFESLCKLLASRREFWQTIHCSDLNPMEISDQISADLAQPLTISNSAWIRRNIGQTVTRFY